jgi:hypothetical protein
LVYYRTQYALLFYEEEPKGKTPDPIAEARVVAVSDTRGRYSIEAFESAIYHMMMVLAPYTYWRGRLTTVTAFEFDEEIDEDELPLSLPEFKRLNYAERYAVFFRSRRERSDWFRFEMPLYWEEKVAPTPRDGDYEYTESYIKRAEEERKMPTRFDNEEGRVKRVA